MSPTPSTTNSRRVVKNALLIFCLSLCLALTGCNLTVDCQSAGVNATTGCTFTGPEMQNARFEVAGQADLHPSNTIWIRGGEALLPLWDTFTMKITKGAETCDFENLTHYTDDCVLCNFCDESPSEFQRCNASPAFTGRNTQVVVFEGFIGADTEGQAMELENSASLFGGCYAFGHAPSPITPTGNATYQLLSPEYSSSYAILTQRNVYVIQNDMPQTTSYALTKYAANPSGDKVWYKWTVQGDPFWEDNFSQNVRIGQVRVLTGTPGTDPITGRFRLQDAKVVRPSRILFFSDFNAIDTSNGNLSDGNDILTHSFENFNRCYVDANKLDGDINLVGIPAMPPMMMRTRCRQNEPGQPARETDFAATPTYLTLEPGSQLTWFVEFYQQEGADFDPTTSGFDPIPPNAVLAIEFTIEEAP